MIRFNLHCDGGHHFDAWFRSNDDFDLQCAKGWVSCPQCESIKIAKDLMAPAISTSRKKEKMVGNALSSQERDFIAQWRKVSEKIREEGDYVGEKFAEEARKIHYGEAIERTIYGEADGDEVKSLVEEGIELLPLPTLPEKKN
ncbi:DUF1178 family protein [Bartonella sp. HY329]|uniref:DUF1178 family protein n=1 Tax=unclassified Bartonella TaxID=2645622 RepID=UPI0021C5A5D2|nr:MULTISPECIES: DUF1178 family protein [unclassified Bartonella]UXM95550.1 DUF1178 family protein [Bartonella sp. HY329]UXN09875.1 DUF1178 family protein [Bartonella sp. HY328]